MSIFKCKMCGGALEINNNETIAVCEYCGTKQTIPTAKDENLQGLYNRANTLRIKAEFDKAEQLYEKILQVDSTQAEAYWGLILCKYGIEYVEDPTTFKRMPTCHRASFDSIIADEDYKSALTYADALQKDIYEAEAKEIDRIQKEIIELSAKEEPYDVFICYKETDDSGKRTQDSAIANDIYYQLTNEGFKVFYAAISLEDKLGSAYEPCIFAALNSSKVMLAIGTKPEYFKAVWVKNEWSRYLKIIKKDRSKLLIPCYKDMDAYELPDEFAHLQAQDMGKIGFINDVVRGIKKVATAQKPKATVIKETVASTASVNITPLLKRAFIFLEDGDWERADDFLEQVLNADPECAEAYLGKLMAELKVKTRDNLKNYFDTFDDRSNYQKAMRFADDKLKAFLDDALQVINERIAQEEEESRRRGLYSRAMDDLNSYDIIHIQRAIDTFTYLAGYKDSEEKIELARMRIERIKAQKEEEKAERERQAEIAREKAERIAKRNKKIAIITTSIVCAIIAFVIVLNAVIIPHIKYNNAVDLVVSGNLSEAYETFVALDGYKDSAEKAKSLFVQYKVEQLKTVTVGDYVTFGSYEQDNNVRNGKESIEWLVLEVKDSKALVISRYVLDCQKYHSPFEIITWEECTLRKMLNTDFIDFAFTAEEKAMIPTVTVSADKNSVYSAVSPGQATQDKVFLLSTSELYNYLYYDTSLYERSCKPTKFAKASGVLVGSDGNCNWWLRTPGRNKNRGTYVENIGIVSSDGYVVDVDSCGVRPAMWIDWSNFK